MNADEMKGYNLGLEDGRRAVLGEMDKADELAEEIAEKEKADLIAHLETQVVDLMNRKSFEHAQLIKERIRELRK